MLSTVYLDRSTKPYALRRSLNQSVRVLLGLQHGDGHWCGELEGDSILESEYILMKWILGQEDDSRLPRIVDSLRAFRRSGDGCWGQFPGSGPDLSATVKAYLCLLLHGDDPGSVHMKQTRQAILDLGGAERINTFSMFYLACMGIVDWDACPTIPPEIVLLPKWLPLCLDHFSAWTRTMVVPLAICSALRSVRIIDNREVSAMRDLFCDPCAMTRLGNPLTASPPSPSSPPLSWKNLFLCADRVLKLFQRVDALPWRRAALDAAERWMLDRSDPAQTDGLGAIFPPMVYQQIAFKALGYDRRSPEVLQAEHDLDALIIEDEQRVRIQPCFSPVWDTGIALYALTDCGYSLANDINGAMRRACAWLCDRQISSIGGWSFEYRNDWYPDIDDTAMVAMALTRCGGEENRQAARRGVQWILALQNDDGGWAAFDRTRHRPILEQVPFADHNAIQDPSCPDITGRVLECLGWHGYLPSDSCVQRAIGFLRSQQEPEGCWFGRWGVNYIYGTWQVVCGLRRIGVDMKEPWIRRAGDWLIEVQREDGGFGESAKSYEDPSLKGIGPATASQTAWGMMALQAVFGRSSPHVEQAAQWLNRTQLKESQPCPFEGGACGRVDEAGSWSEREFTGTGFPRVFYLRYHLYRLYFPVMALGRYTVPESGGC